MNSKIGVAISGGVDSAVTAHLLKERGHEIVAIFMRLGIGDESSLYAVEQICQKLGIELQILEMSTEFQKQVIDYFIQSYQQGHTPNPCIRCNKFIKFHRLLEASRRFGCDYLATGHYARILFEQPREEESESRLYQAMDKNKDQSYFLYTLDQQKLKNILFPLGEYKKETIYQISETQGLNLKQGESQDICFLSGDHNEFLRENIVSKKGTIRTLDDTILGEHHGVHLFTLGQRKGLDIGGSGPYYVIHRDQKENIVYVSKDKDDPRLYKNSVLAHNVNWIKRYPPEQDIKYSGKIRYNMPPQECSVKKKGEGLWEIRFSQSIRAIAEGQSMVIYNGEEVLGGGEIIQVYNT